MKPAVILTVLFILVIMNISTDGQRHRLHGRGRGRGRGWGRGRGNRRFGNFQNNAAVRANRGHGRFRGGIGHQRGVDMMASGVETATEIPNIKAIDLRSRWEKRQLQRLNIPHKQQNVDVNSAVLASPTENNKGGWNIRQNLAARRRERQEQIRLQLQQKQLQMNELKIAQDAKKADHLAKLAAKQELVHAAAVKRKAARLAQLAAKQERIDAQRAAAVKRKAARLAQLAAKQERMDAQRAAAVKRKAARLAQLAAKQERMDAQRAAAVKRKAARLAQLAAKQERMDAKRAAAVKRKAARLAKQAAKKKLKANMVTDNAGTHIPNPNVVSLADKDIQVDPNVIHQGTPPDTLFPVNVHQVSNGHGRAQDTHANHLGAAANPTPLDLSKGIPDHILAQFDTPVDTHHNGHAFGMHGGPSITNSLGGTHGGAQDTHHADHLGTPANPTSVDLSKGIPDHIRAQFDTPVDTHHNGHALEMHGGPSIIDMHGVTHGGAQDTHADHLGAPANPTPLDLSKGIPDHILAQFDTPVDTHHNGHALGMHGGPSITDSLGGTHGGAQDTHHADHLGTPANPTSVDLSKGIPDHIRAQFDTPVDTHHNGHALEMHGGPSIIDMHGVTHGGAQDTHADHLGAPANPTPLDLSKGIPDHIRAQFDTPVDTHHNGHALEMHGGPSITDMHGVTHGGAHDTHADHLGAPANPTPLDLSKGIPDHILTQFDTLVDTHHNGHALEIHGGPSITDMHGVTHGGAQDMHADHLGAPANPTPLDLSNGIPDHILSKFDTPVDTHHNGHALEMHGGPLVTDIHSGTHGGAQDTHADHLGAPAKPTSVDLSKGIPDHIRAQFDTPVDVHHTVHANTGSTQGQINSQVDAHRGMHQIGQTQTDQTSSHTSEFVMNDMPIIDLAMLNIGSPLPSISQQGGSHPTGVLGDATHKQKTSNSQNAWFDSVPSTGMPATPLPAKNDWSGGMPATPQPSQNVWSSSMTATPESAKNDWSGGMLANPQPVKNDWSGTMAAVIPQPVTNAHPVTTKPTENAWPPPALGAWPPAPDAWSHIEAAKPLSDSRGSDAATKTVTTKQSSSVPTKVNKTFYLDHLVRNISRGLKTKA